MPLQTFQMVCMGPASLPGCATTRLAVCELHKYDSSNCNDLQLGTGKVPIGASATVELSGPDARAMNNPAYYQHSEESKRLADVSCCCLKAYLELLSKPSKHLAEFWLVTMSQP